MNTRGLHVLSVVVTLMMVGEASGQDPGLRDSLIIGNLNGSVIPVRLNQEIVLPVWIKTDDSVTYFHTPLATDNGHIVMRLGGDLSEPLSLWDEVDFLTPNANSPSPGYTSQSILGFAYLFDPRDPQNFLYTNYQWWHVADFHILTTSDTLAIGDTAELIEGFSPANGGLLWGIPDGVTQIIPAARYPRLYFTENAPPEFTRPGPGAEFYINNEFPIQIIVEATDADNHVISMSVDFPVDGARLDTIDISPGHSIYRFKWRPGIDDSGQFIATFTANDNHGGIVDLDVAVNVTPAVVEIEEIEGFPGLQVSVPVNINNSGESSNIGGFDLYLQYEVPDIIGLLSVERAPRIDSWEYFHVTYGDTCTMRITGIADIYGSGNPLTPGDGPVIFLNFEITDDSIYVGQYAEINFILGDENDNTVSDSTGYLLIHPALDSGWVHNQDPGDILIGDINLNGIAWEISDAVLMANHILRPDEFQFDYVQMLASDTNRDGYPGTVPDLVYLINVINGFIIPPPTGYGPGAAARLTAEFDEMDSKKLLFKYDSSIPAGAILLRLDHGDNEIISVESSTGLNLGTSDVEGILSVMLFDYRGGIIFPGDIILGVELAERDMPVVAELQISDRNGYFIPAPRELVQAFPRTFALHGAYPNPFNSRVSMRFSLPESSDIDVDIYNILGQVVKSIHLGKMPSGECSVDWDGSDDSGEEVSSGVYIYRITAGEFEATSRMTLLK